MYSIKLSSARRFNMRLGLGCVLVMPKSHRNTAGFTQMPQGQRRAFTASEKRRQYMQHAVQKAIYRWNGVRDESCNATVWIHPSLNASVSAAGTTPTVVSVNYAGICMSIWVNKKCHVLSVSLI